MNHIVDTTERAPRENLMPEMSEAAYYALYRGQTVLVKVGGAEILNERFASTADTIRRLVRDDVRIILTFGGGERINECWKKDGDGTQRQKIDGVAVTTDAQMELAVIPAYKEIRGKLAELIPELVFTEPEQISCEVRGWEFKRTGVPHQMTMSSDDDAIGIGFVGTTGKQLVNMNADDVAQQILNGDNNINEVIFLTGKPLQDINGNMVSLITLDRLGAVYAGKDEHIAVEGGMKQKVKVVIDMLESGKTNKVAMTNDLHGEIASWAGSGTLCVRGDKFEAKPMLKREEPIFNAVYKHNLAAGNFRERTLEELEQLSDSHFLMRVDNSPLGGVSLVHHPDCVELAVLWSGYKGNGMGARIVTSALDRDATRHKKIYAISSEETTFMAAGFTKRGALEDVMRQADAPAFIRNYELKARPENAPVRYVFELDPRHRAKSDKLTDRSPRNP